MKNNGFKLIAAVVFALLLVSSIWLAKIYAFLTVAFVLAYLLDPIVEKLAAWRVPRAFGVVVTLVVFFSILALAGVVIVPKLVAQAQELLIRLPQLGARLSLLVSPVSERYLGFNVLEDANRLLVEFGGPGTLARPLGELFRDVFSHTFKLVTTVLGLLIIPMLAYYVLRDYPTLYARFLTLVPKRHHKTVSELRDRLDVVLGGFIRGQLVVSGLLSVYYGIAFTALGLDLSVILGIMAGFFNMVPYIGILIVLAVTILVALIHGAGTSTLVAVLAVFGVGMAIEGAWLTPKIVGRKVGLGPLTLILALLIGGELLGFVGMLLAVPLAAIAKVFLVLLLDRYRRSELFHRPSA